MTKLDRANSRLAQQSRGSLNLGGQPDSTMSRITFTVSIPTDEGFIGRQCNHPDCTRYFRVQSTCVRDRMYCPYCGTLASNHLLHTKAQALHLRQVAKEKALEYAHNEIDKMLGNLAREFRGNAFFKFKHTPTRYRAKPVNPRYKEHKVDSELLCPTCSFRFQVFGIFGFCPGCGIENMLVYDANLTIICRDIEGSANPTRSLRHAYGDLVSTFQIFCSRKAEAWKGEKPTFQELFPTRKYFKEQAGVDIFEGLTISDLLTLRRLFQKRHVCQHAGKITEQYIKKIPEDRELLGCDVPLSLAEFREAADVLRRVLDKLCRKLERRI